MHPATYLGVSDYRRSTFECLIPYCLLLFYEIRYKNISRNDIQIKKMRVSKSIYGNPTLNDLFYAIIGSNLETCYPQLTV